jgi:hypothetical protein
MIGTNRILMNDATLNKALEFYLNRDLLQSGEAVTVNYAFPGTGANNGYHVVEVKPAKKEKA